MGKFCSKDIKKTDSKINYVPKASSKQLFASKEIKDSEKLDKVTFKVSLENLKAKNFSHVKRFYVFSIFIKKIRIVVVYILKIIFFLFVIKLEYI